MPRQPNKLLRLPRRLSPQPQKRLRRRGWMRRQTPSRPTLAPLLRLLFSGLGHFTGPDIGDLFRGWLEVSRAGLLLDLAQGGVVRVDNFPG